ncbi:Uncharacterised protein [Mycobacteroides abscessus subsp. abscessus]|nr:Uncharacterised protein [Mycobacteroides abscessus subsp. abscessus]
MGTPAIAPARTANHGVRKAPSRAAHPAAAPMKAAPVVKAMTLGLRVTPQMRFERIPVKAPAAGPARTPIITVPMESR